MNTKIINSKGCKRCLEVKVPASEVEKKFTEVYGEIKKVAEIPGFRPGKAPQDIIEQKFREKAEGEVLKELISSSYEDALDNLKIAPIEFPQITDVKLERGKPLSYKAEVDIRPEVKLKKYKGLKVRKDKPGVGDADAEKALSNLQEVHAKFIAADTRSVASGDYVVCDVRCVAGEKEIFKKEAMWLSVSEDMATKEIYKGLLGMKKDEEKKIPAKLPKDYPDKELAGKDVTYEVKVRNVKEKKLPQLDDAFAKDIGKSDMRELKEAVKKDLLKRQEIAVNEDMRRQVIEELLKNSSFEMPESIVKRQLANLVNDAKERMLSQGVKKEDIESNIPKIEERLKPQAARDIKVLFLLNEVARLENIKVGPSEVDKTMEIMAAQFKKDKKKLLQEYEEKNLLQNIIGQIREEKTMEFLLKEAEIAEKGGRK